MNRPIEMNRPKGKSSEDLKECLNRNCQRFLSEDLYIEIYYFKTGVEALQWKVNQLCADRGMRPPAIIPVENPGVLEIVDWTIRRIDGSINIAIVEDNLRAYSGGNKKAIEGVSFHILGHIEDMEERDIILAFPEWMTDFLGAEETEFREKIEEIKLAEIASTISLEYRAEKIAIEKGAAFLNEFRRRSANFELKQGRRKFKRIKRSEIIIPTKKDFLFSGLDPSAPAYRLAWKKSDYRDLYLKTAESLEEKIQKVFSKKFGGAGERTIKTIKKYHEELEEALMKENLDVSDFRKVRQVLRKFLK